MKKRLSIFIAIAIIFIIIGVVRFKKFEYGYVPSDERIINKTLNYDSLKKVATKEEVGNEDKMKLGKEKFFTESFGNEIFFTDIMGITNGPFTLKNVAIAVVKLRGQGTSNLKVEAAQSYKSGNISIKKGDLIDTGIDVAKGAYAPIGIITAIDKGVPKVGVACAACHATVDKKGNVVAGSPNSDFNIGLILAMATNSSSYFTHTELGNIRDFIESGNVNSPSLPDIKKLEKYVDSEFVKWIPGSNDTTIDLKNNPVQIPDAFTLGDGPYGWSGQGQVGPFNGLSAAINNAHSQNMDAVSQSEISEPVLRIDKDLYLGTLLQNAANKKYRYNPNSNEKASNFFKKVDPNPEAPGVSELVKAATYPRISYLQSVGLLPGSPGYKVWEQIDSISLYMNSLVPLTSDIKKDEKLFNVGKEVFSKAGCTKCHGGKYLTNNKVIEAEKIGTEPSRAAGFKGTQLFFTDPKFYDMNTEVPLPKKPKVKDLELSTEEKKSLALSWAHGTSKGGYKTISLYGLKFSAPYLHDGGVAVGKNGELGLPNTLMKGKIADPENSLQAMLDSQLRKQVIEANYSSKELRTSHVTGEGHEFWVDETTGFSIEEQQALINYLLKVND
ncbi:MAG: electron transport protein [Bacillales bacterium]|nr:electron transport protein [Bacillales bacterium]